MDFEQVQADTLLRGDMIMLKENQSVCYGKVNRIIEQTSTRTFLELSDVIYEDGSKENKSYVTIKNSELYHSDKINESIQILDGTEPFSNGVYLVNVPDTEIIERNRRVDEYTEKLLAGAKELIDKPIKISVEENITEEQSEPDLTEREEEFKPITITKK